MKPKPILVVCSAAAALLPWSVSGSSFNSDFVLKLHPAGSLSGRAAISPIMQAGHPAPDPLSGILADSPDLRVDANTKTSPFAGVGSMFTDDDPTDSLGYIGSATPIDRWHVLTAAHVFDVLNEDGVSDVLPQNSYFILNNGSDFSSIIQGKSVALNPNFNGFAAGPNDDLALVTLSEPLPLDVPIYPLADPSWFGVNILTMAGYGTSGDGLNGYSVGPEFNVKRSGANILEYAELDDEGGPLPEVIAWDFEYEGDPARYDVFGLPIALPNRVETNLGGGDSGGPSFMHNPLDATDPNLYLAAVNTFTFTLGIPDHDVDGAFGSGGGGIWLNREYQSWLRASVPENSYSLVNMLIGCGALAIAARSRLGSLRK